ncbi:MAG: mandelate racemase/muconate lactonizing enzyme family protein [Caldilineaceae bacterium]|nr:mandelate racemase/muconate lactonizing enzyme family protein [Caldilineaceae bacterium]MCB0123920.1 mandelate racemase/muconate lactonizing enzyme family protein [Caldilineaceae bacterium]
MKITAVRVFELEGAARRGEALYETTRGGLAPGEVSAHRGTFTQIETDEGISGLALGGSAEVKALGQRLIGEDPMAVEYLWEKIFTSGYPHMRHLHALSTLDLALWDLNGHAKNEPVYHLLGGPCQPRLRAYAALLGFATEPERAAERSLAWVEKGFTGLKWYLPYNEAAGEEGLRQNEALVRAVREAVGDSIDLMVDCILANSSGNSLLYAIKLARRLEPYRLTWLEEPLNPEDLEAYSRLARATTIPLAFGERLVTRWQFKQALEAGVATVHQPELASTGGLTEMRKIAALLATYGMPLIPHANETSRNAIHLLFALPPRIAPLAEWGIKINHNFQFFFQDFYEPVNGYFELPTGTGFGYAIDEDKVVARREL